MYEVLVSLVCGGRVVVNYWHIGSKSETSNSGRDNLIY